MPQFRSVGGIAAHIGLVGKPPQYTTFRYMRVFVVQSISTTAATIAEIQFRTAVGVAITNPPGTGGAIGGDFDAGIVGYGKAFSNSGADYWKKTGSMGTLTWVGWDYGVGNSINCRQVLIQAGPSGEASNAPADLKIEASNNGSTWTTLLTPATQGSWTSNESRLFNLP